MRKPKTPTEVKYADKPYPCDECPKAFTHRNSLSKHKKDHHPKLGSLTDHPNPTEEEQLEQEEEMRRMIEKHDRNVEISANTYLTPRDCQKMSTYKTDIECDDDDICGSHTVYEKREVQDRSSGDYPSVRDSEFGSPVVTTASGKKITLADPHAPPGSSCNRSSFSPSSSSTNSRQSMNSRQKVSLRTSDNYVQLRNSSQVTFDRNKPINSQERKSIYGNNLNTGDYNPGKPHYEKDDDDDYDDENSFYNTKLHPTSKKDSAPISQFIKNGQFDPNRKNNQMEEEQNQYQQDNQDNQDNQDVLSRTSNKSSDFAERSEDWRLDPRYDDGNSAPTSLRSSSNSLLGMVTSTSTYGTVSAINPIGRQLVDKAILQYSKDAATGTLTDVNAHIPRDLEDVQDTAYNANSLTDLNDDENQNPSEPILPPITFLKDPQTLGPLPKNNPVYYKHNNVTIKCIVREDYLVCLNQYYKDPLKAIVHIKNIGIASDQEEADFRTIKKIYFEGKKKSELPIRVLDLSRHKMEFLDSEQKWRTDCKGQICSEIICKNLTNALLRMNNHMIRKILLAVDDTREALLDEWQIHKTQCHASNLGTTKFRLRLVKRIMDFIYNLSEEQIID